LFTIKWIGSLLYLNKLSGNSWQSWTTPASAIAGYWFIYDLKFDKNGQLYLGGNAPEWNFALFTERGIEPVKDVSKAVYRIAVDEDNNKWLATAYGLVKYDGRTFVTYTAENSDLPFNDLYDVKEDGQGNLWLASGKYLVKFDSNVFTNYGTPLDTGNEQDFIVSLEFDSAGDIWIGSKLSGLFKLAPVVGRILSARREPPTFGTLKTLSDRY
jgi:ligand-binding sensor domain-containing protein